MEEQVKRIVSEILKRGAKDPRIGFVSVTGVEISADLRNARVFVSMLGEPSEVEKTLGGLQSARSYIQRELGRRMSSRYTPVISFHRDDSISYGLRIEGVIRELKEKGDWSGEDDEGSA